MQEFTIQSMFEIINILEIKLKTLKSKDILEFQTSNLDYRTWVDLSQLLYCKMLTPVIVDTKKVIIRFEKLNINNSFHKKINSNNETYGTNSIFATINKNEQPAFLYYYKQALKNVNIDKRIRILNLGINNADEFKVIQQYSSNFENLDLVGIDYCKSAIKEAKIKFPHKNVSFINCDINDLETLNLELFDLIITIGTLQSSNISFNSIFMNLVQNNLKKDGAMILGFPNCRWIDGEMLYGAFVPNYSFSELSLLYKDVIFCKKYLQQKKFRVTITGKDYIFLTATSIRK